MLDKGRIRIQEVLHQTAAVCHEILGLPSKMENATFSISGISNWGAGPSRTHRSHSYSFQITPDITNLSVNLPMKHAAQFYRLRL
jgi:hypothetical protein